MQRRTILQESEMILEKIYERQAILDVQIGELERSAFDGIREELGYGPPEQVDTPNLIDTRIEYDQEAIDINGLKAALSISRASAETNLTARRNVEKILSGNDSRLIVIIGPCSIHNPKEALKYAGWVGQMRDLFADELEIIMRAYFEKPRTVLGWKGLMRDPKLDGSHNISLGMVVSRMTACQITDSGVPIATERIDSRTTQALDGLVTIDPIGARDAESTRARDYLSVTSAVGAVKNPTDGDLKTLAQAIETAMHPHTYLGDGKLGKMAEIRSRGNPTVFPILRGGRNGPNYQNEYVRQLCVELRAAGLQERVAIDASHGNSGKNPERQMEVITDVVQQKKLGEKAIMVVMIESYLRAGRQDFDPKTDDPRQLKSGISITDGCVDLNVSFEMLQMLADAVRETRN